MVETRLVEVHHASRADWDDKINKKKKKKKKKTSAQVLGEPTHDAPWKHLQPLARNPLCCGVGELKKKKKKHEIKKSFSRRALLPWRPG